MKHIIELEEVKTVIHKVTVDIPDEHKRDVDSFLNYALLTIPEPKENLSQYVDALNEKMRVLSVDENVRTAYSEVSFKTDYPYRLAKD